MKRFQKGIRLPGFKDATLLSPRIHTPLGPHAITVFLSQGLGDPLTPCVTEGEMVLAGSKIAEGSSWASVPIHSSVSGRVSEVTDCFIRIESDTKDTLHPSIHPRAEIPTDPESLAEIIREAGILDLESPAFPAHLRLLEAQTAGVETVLVNACESEPFVTANHLLVLNHPGEILKGAELLRVASGAKRAVIVLTDDKREVAEILNSKNYNLKIKTVEVLILESRFPQGFVRTLAQTWLGRKLFRNESPIEAGVLVQNAATAFAVYEAVYLKKPFYERVVTVGGPCIFEPKNFWAKVGTPAHELIGSAKGFLREPERVIFGGPMTGVTIGDLEAPVTKSTSAILALPAELTISGAEESCIRCGLCVEACPEDLRPEMILRAVRHNQMAVAREYAIDSCTECGICAYLCPSKIPLVDVIRKGKKTFLTEIPNTKSVHALSFQA